MLTTILLCWYALGLTGVGYWCYFDEEELKVKDLFMIMLLAPLIVVLPIVLLSDYWETVIWRKGINCEKKDEDRGY